LTLARPGVVTAGLRHDEEEWEFREKVMAFAVILALVVALVVVPWLLL
jgi:hypothetical protein